MWPFKKKKIKEEYIEGSKFKVGDTVRFRYKDELTFGTIWHVRKDINQNIVYDIQVGGQCPWMAEGIYESIIHPYEQKSVVYKL